MNTPSKISACRGTTLIKHHDKIHYQIPTHSLTHIHYHQITFYTFWLIFKLIWFLMLTAKHLAGHYNVFSGLLSLWWVYPCQQQQHLQGVGKKNMLALFECLLNVRKLKDILARNVLLSSCPRWRQELFDLQTWFMWFLFSESKT